jgi:hypothetical protein
MITIHTLADYDVDGQSFGVTVLAQGNKGKSQKIFYVLETNNIDDPEWYIGRYVSMPGPNNPKGLTSIRHRDIGNFPGQKDNPMKVFDLYPEYFL